MRMTFVDTAKPLQGVQSFLNLASAQGRGCNGRRYYRIHREVNEKNVNGMPQAPKPPSTLTPALSPPGRGRRGDRHAGTPRPWGPAAGARDHPPTAAAARRA